MIPIPIIIICQKKKGRGLLRGKYNTFFLSFRQLAGANWNSKFYYEFLLLEIYIYSIYRVVINRLFLYTKYFLDERGTVLERRAIYVFSSANANVTGLNRFMGAIRFNYSQIAAFTTL